MTYNAINPFNPLLAARVDAPPDAWSGVWIVQNIELIEQGVRDGSWIETSLGTVGASLDTLGLMVDPVGTLLQYAAAWVIEHVKPLSEALNWLAGNPAQIVAHAQTWRNVAARLQEDATNLGSAQRNELPDWSGTAAQTYQTWGTEQRNAITGLAKASATMATITECAGFLIGAVRVMVRDLIATAVSRLIVYAGEELFSVGLATPLVVAQVTSLVASCAAKISRWLEALLASLRRLMALVRRLGELIDDLKKILGRLLGIRKAGPTTETVERDLFAFGGKKEDGFPRPPRESDLYVKSREEPVGPYHPQKPTDNVGGASTYTSVEAGQAQKLTGQVFRLPEGTKLPEGYGVHADGADVGGNASPGHRTIYPTEQMPLSQFQDTFGSKDFGWEWYGTVNKKGVFTPAPKPEG